MPGFDLSIGGWIISSVVISLLLLGLRSWLPKAAGRRVAERGSLVGSPLKPSYEDTTARRTGADLQKLANRKLHDDMLEEAVKLKLRARTGEHEERVATLNRAIEKTLDALTARPESYDGTKLLAELYLDRALLNNDPASVADLEQAAQLFTKASSFRLGVIDNYVGKGWAYLQMTNVDPDFSHIYGEKAAIALAAGHERVKQNVWILRGWGVALDRLARSPQNDPAKLAEFEARYRTALNEHRGGQHDLFDWYSSIRRETVPVWVDVPPLRDVY